MAEGMNDQIGMPQVEAATEASAHGHSRASFKPKCIWLFLAEPTQWKPLHATGVTEVAPADFHSSDPWQVSSFSPSYQHLQLAGDLNQRLFTASDPKFHLHSKHFWYQTK